MGGNFNNAAVKIYEIGKRLLFGTEKDRTFSLRIDDGVDLSVDGPSQVSLPFSKQRLASHFAGDFVEDVTEGVVHV